MNWYKKSKIEDISENPATEHRWITEKELRDLAKSVDYSLVQCVECGRWADFMKKAISDWKFEDEMSESELKVVSETKDAIDNGRGKGLSTCKHCVSKDLKNDLKNFQEIMATSEHYIITCKCGDVHKCRCINLIHKEHPPTVAHVDSCPTCEENKEAAVNSTMSVSPSVPMSEDVSISPRQIYTRDDVIQNREDIAPSMLRKRLKRKKKEEKGDIDEA